MFTNNTVQDLGKVINREETARFLPRAVHYMFTNNTVQDLGKVINREEKQLTSFSVQYTKCLQTILFRI